MEHHGDFLSVLFNAFVWMMFTSAVEFSGRSHANYIKKKNLPKLFCTAVLNVTWQVEDL